MSRFKAFAIHLGISLTIFALVLGLLVLVWYPWPLFGLESGWRGLRLVALVDIVLGPALTLILFRVGKPGLKFDMSMVVLMQVGALAFGMWNLYEARPILLVHASDHFKPLSRTLLAEWDPSGELLREWESMTPQKLRVKVPDDPIRYADLYHQSFSVPGRLHGLADLYQPLSEGWQQMLWDAVRIESYTESKADWRQTLDRFVKAQGRAVEELAFFPYVGRRERVFLAFDRNTKAIVGVLEIPYDPALARPEVSRRDRGGLKKLDGPRQTGG